MQAKWHATPFLGNLLLLAMYQDLSSLTGPSSPSWVKTSGRFQQLLRCPTADLRKVELLLKQPVPSAVLFRHHQHRMNIPAAASPHYVENLLQPLRQKLFCRQLQILQKRSGESPNADSCSKNVCHSPHKIKGNVTGMNSMTVVKAPKMKRIQST